MEILRELQQNLPPFAVDIIRLGIWVLLLMMIFVPLERLFAAPPEDLSQELADRPWLLLSERRADQVGVGVPDGGACLGAASRGACSDPSRCRGVASVGTPGGGVGGRRIRLLLGPSLDPRDSLPVALRTPSITAPSKSTG
jgi:hypothetical protein